MGVNRLARLIRTHAYVGLCLAVAPLVIWRVATRTWLGDFWEHAAVIGELAQRPLDPNHPMLASADPHALNSPYHLAIAVVVRAFDLSPIDGLSAAALVNFALLCVGLALFVRVMTRRPLAAFGTLLFTLVLWGPDPWVWSGFYHVGSLSVVMPYPSAFATGLAFLAIWSVRTGLLSGRWTWSAVVAVLAWFIVLTHPPTAVFLLIGTGALLVRYWHRGTRRAMTHVVVALAVAFALAPAWPYFPVLGLVGSDASGYARDNDTLLTLSGVLIRLLPAFVGLPFLVGRLRRRVRDPLVLIFAGTVAVYLAARVGQIGSLATTIRFAVLMLHIAAAAGLGALALRRLPGRLRDVAPASIVVVSMAVLLSLPTTAWGRGVAGLGRDAAPDLSGLETRVPDDAIVMTDQLTGLEVPAWGPKVVAWEYAMPFVADAVERRTAVDQFFAARTDTAARQAILAHWCATWIVIVPERLERVGGAEMAQLLELGQIVATGKDGRSILVRAPTIAACDPRLQALRDVQPELAEGRSAGRGRNWMSL